VPEVAGQHAGPSEHGRRYLGGFGHRLSHDPFERSLTEAAGEQVADEVHLSRGCPGEEVVDELRPGAHRSGASRAGELGEGAVELRDGDGVGGSLLVLVTDRAGFSGRSVTRMDGLWAGRVGPASGDRLRKCRPADPDPPLAGFADEEPDGGLDLVRGQPPQQIGQRGDLGRAGRCGRHPR
jgi:hypothetical protein